MTTQVLEMLDHDKLQISDRELNSEMVDRICELLSGFLVDDKEAETFRKNLHSIRYSGF